jgi:hypothetical protein
MGSWVGLMKDIIDKSFDEYLTSGNNDKKYSLSTDETVQSEAVKEEALA